MLGTWDRMAADHEINVMLDAEVKAITGEKGDFTLALANGETVEAENVILAIGTQGNPNLVRCPVGDGAVVQYQLDDPGEYVDEHIVVIGAGDAGIENALGLAADPEQRNRSPSSTARPNSPPPRTPTSRRCSPPRRKGG